MNSFVKTKYKIMPFPPFSGFSELFGVETKLKPQMDKPGLRCISNQAAYFRHGHSKHRANQKFLHKIGQLPSNACNA